MKYTHIAALIGAITIMTAQLFGQTETPAASGGQRRIRTLNSEAVPPPTYEVRKFATADLTNIRLNVVSGHIVFTAADIDYVYYPRSNEHTTPAGDVTACLAVLAELRKAEAFEVQVPVRLPDMPADRKRITVSELTIPIGKLK